MDLKNLLPLLFRTMKDKGYDTDLFKAQMMQTGGNQASLENLFKDYTAGLSDFKPDNFPSQKQGGIPLNGMENSPQDLSNVFNYLSKEAVDLGEAPFSDGKDYIYNDVMYNTPATASAAALVDNNPNIGLEQLADEKLGNDITNRIGNNEYSVNDIANMDDSDLDLDTLELLKKAGLR